MNSQPSSVSIRSMVVVGGGAPATTMRTCPGPGISPSQSWRRVEHRSTHGGSTTHQRDAVLVDPTQDLGSVDLAQHDVLHAHADDGVEHPPAVAVEHRQRVEVHVPVVTPTCQPNVTALVQRARCVCSTPLGRAVVPEV